MGYSRTLCTPQITDGVLMTEGHQPLTQDLCENECNCIRKSICLRLIKLLRGGHVKDAENEYKKFISHQK